LTPSARSAALLPTFDSRVHGLSPAAARRESQLFSREQPDLGNKEGTQEFSYIHRADSVFLCTSDSFALSAAAKQREQQLENITFPPSSSQLSEAFSAENRCKPRKPFSSSTPSAGLSAVCERKSAYATEMAATSLSSFSAGSVLSPAAKLREQTLPLSPDFALLAKVAKVEAVRQVTNTKMRQFANASADCSPSMYK
jgi:hypothetical protein